MGKLNETLDLITLYCHHVGKREVPPEYDKWAAISLIAACVGNRVWYEKFTGSKLYPNLYVVLVGPSALGKGIAIDDSTLPYVSHVPLVNMYRGKATAPFVVDTLAGGGRKQNPCLYLVTPELALSVGSGTLADEFIKMMTELFTGGEYKFQYGTRTKGNVTFRGHCVNWLGASTEDWFVGALTKEAVEGGAMGRIALIKEGYQRVRVPRPERSPDYYELRQHIQARVYNLICTAGQFVMTERAKRIHEQWYMDREDPDESKGEGPTWRRLDDLTLKLAMVCSLSEGRGELVITAEDWERGNKLAYDALRAVPDIVKLASTPLEAAGLHLVSEAIERAGEIQRQALVKKMSHRGMMATKVHEFVTQLKDEGLVEEGMRGRGIWYRWLRRRMK